MLLVGFLLGSTIIIIPGSSAHQNAWIAYLLGWIGGFILFAVYLTLYKRHKGKTLVEINQILLGKKLGNVISILYIWYFIHLGTLVIRNFTEYTLTVNLPETPLWFITIMYMFIIAYSVKSGLEVTSRVAELIIPLIFIFQIGITLLLIPHMEALNLLPIMEYGIGPILESSLSVLTFPFGETVVFLMLFPYLNKHNELKKSFLNSFILGGALLLLAVLRDISVLGEAGIARKIFPPHIAAKRIEFTNLDSIIGVIFFISGGTKISICYLASAIGLAQLTKSKDHRIFVYPLAIIFISLSLWIYNNTPQMLQWAINVWPYYSIPFQIIIPTVLLFISMIRERPKSLEDKAEN